MLPPFDYFQHRAACTRKQERRAELIAALPRASLTASERDILDEDIDTLVQNVQEKRLSPHDILRAYTKVVVKAQEKTNCVTEVMVKEAGKWLEEDDINLEGPLAGIPVSLKDSINVGGFDTSIGYSSLTGKPHMQDGALVRLLKDAGAVPFVKTALPITLLSFESFNDTWGRCLNPHNPKYSPGGSSGGEGAILAFGASRVGVGSDVAGSVRAPAHWSGCYSLRCSTGRWPKLGVTTSTLGQEGIPSVFSPMARTLLDLTYFSRSIIQMQPWKYDPSVHPIEWRIEVETDYQDGRPLKVGIMRTDNVVDPSPACARALDMAANALRDQGHIVFDVSPPRPFDALVIAASLLNADGTRTYSAPFRTGETNDAGAANFGWYMQLPRVIKWFYWAYTKYIKRDDLWAELISDWHEKSAFENWKLVARREAYRVKWHEWWNSFGEKGSDLDVILTPPNATPALPHKAMSTAAAACGYTFLFNLLDYSCGILPVTHVDAKLDVLPSSFKFNKLNGIAQGAYKYYDAQKMAGLPVAVQVVGRRLEEEKVLACMQVLEDALAAKGEKYHLLPVS